MICPKICLHFRWKLSEADEKFGQFFFGIRCAFTRFCFSALSLFGFWKRNCFWDFSFWDSDHFGSSKKLLRKGCRRGLAFTVRDWEIERLRGLKIGQNPRVHFIKLSLTFTTQGWIVKLDLSLNNLNLFIFIPIYHIIQNRRLRNLAANHLLSWFWVPCCDQRVGLVKILNW